MSWIHTRKEWGRLILGLAQVALAWHAIGLAWDGELGYGEAFGGGVVGLIAAGGAFFSFRSGAALWRERSELARAQIEHPGEPWRWRADWAAGRILDRRGRGGPSVRRALPYLAAGGLLCALALYFAWGDWWEIIGGALLGPASLWQLHDGLIEHGDPFRFGRLEFAVRSIPVAPGGRLAGTIRVGRAPAECRTMNLALVCYQAGAVSGLAELEIGRRDWALAPQAATRAGRQMYLPVEVELPAEWPAADRAICWELRLDCEVPGPNLRAEFPLPVYAAPAAPA